MAYGQNMDAPMSGLMGLAAMKGRMGDNTLVHVNPTELKTLNALAGPGGLTQNPSTGLPEAFKIKDLLPILGAIAMPYAAPALLAGTGAAAGGLASTLASNAALMSGVGGAAGTALAGGNKEEILGSGLASGLTAGLTGGFGSSADKVAAASKTVGEAGYEAGRLASSRVAKGLGQNIAGETAAKTITAPMTVLSKSGLPVTQAATNVVSKGVSDAVAGELGAQALKSGAATGLAAAVTSPGMFDVPKEPTYTPPSTVPYTERTQTASKEDIDRYIRQGGATPQFFSFNQTQIPAQFGGMAKGGSMGDVPTTYMAQGSNEGMFSGMVKAPEGDGMSDNVAFEVVGDPEIKQAMLSPDEYVIDAQTVSLLGNGSSDAGAKELDEFRRLVRDKGTGREAQQNQINASKELRRLV